MRDINWDAVSEVGSMPKAGGYAAKIIGVEDREDKEFLLITWDFADGQYKGSNRDCEVRKGFLPHHAKTVKSYKESALPFFKGFKTAVEKSNSGYVFRNDPQSLVGKYMGVVLGEEEYEANDGSIKTRLYVSEIRSGQAIREGDYKIPELKRLPGRENAPAKKATADIFDAVEESEEDLPF